MTSGFAHELNMENQIDKQIGCMTGFLQIFDRHQILAGKRLHSTKRLLPPPPTVVGSPSELEKSAEASLPVNVMPLKSPLRLPILGPKEGASWDLCKETPRHSLDSRATTDVKGGLHPKEISQDAQLHRSHTIIAKLMGLDPLPNPLNARENEKKPELRRSSSDSRVSRGFLHSRLTVESNNFPLTQEVINDNVAMENESYTDSRKINLFKDDYCGVNLSPWKAPQHRKSFFDSVDNFPEPKQNVSAQSDFEKRLKLRGIEEPTNDLETLKSILEALQLKGLLHSTKPAEQNRTRHQKFVYNESPIVVMKPSRSSVNSPHQRTGDEYPPGNGRSPERQIRRNYSIPVENSPPVIPHRARRSNSFVKPASLSVETQRRARRIPPAFSPKLHTTMTGSDPLTRNRPPRSKKATGKEYQKANYSAHLAGEDEWPSISGNNLSTYADTQRYKTEGRNLLERCDKLLHSIAEMATAADMQPSPVSVLDSSFYRDDSSTTSPVTAKRKIHFKDHYGSTDEETLSSWVLSTSQETYEDSDFLYISDIVSAFNLIPGESELFLSLERHQFQKGHDSSKASRLQRKVVFDTITDLLKWIRRLPPWKNVSWSTDDVTSPSLDKIWLEFQRVRDCDRDDAEDMYGIICSILKKDISRDEITGWKDFPMEMSETILDMERLVFKDLIGETIQDLAAVASENRLSRMGRKKMVFRK